MHPGAIHPRSEYCVHGRCRRPREFRVYEEQRMKNLVVVMAGDKSLHTEYSVDRDFDLWTIYYGDFEHIFTRYRSFSDRIWRRKGLKFELARRILLEELYFGQNFDFNAYDFIFLPDDD